MIYFMRSMKNRNGFSLVELMIVAGVIGTLSMAGMQLIKMMNQSNASFNANTEMTFVQKEIAMLLLSKENCTESFGGADPTNDTSKSIIKRRKNDGTYADAFTLNTPYGTGSVQIESLKLSDTDFDPQNEADFVNNNTTHLIIQFKTKEGTGNARTVAKKVKIIAVGNPITECYTEPSFEEIWKRSTTNSDNIYYGDGFVGIGTSTPRNKLHVVSDAVTNPGESAVPATTIDRYENSSGTVTTGLQIRRFRGTPTAKQNLQSGDFLGSLDFMGRVSSAEILQSGIRANYDGNGNNNSSNLTFYTSNQAKIFVRSNGHVSIGDDYYDSSVRLNVQGAIKGSAFGVNASCTNAQLGASGYDSASGAPVYCNGSQWKLVYDPTIGGQLSIVNGTACPPGKNIISKYFSGGSCSVSDNSICTTSSGWKGPVATSECAKQVCAVGADQAGECAMWATAQCTTSGTFTKVLCD